MPAASTLRTMHGALCIMQVQETLHLGNCTRQNPWLASESLMVAITSPTVRRRRLGHELRRLRESRHLSCDQVGRLLEWSGAKVSRIETARVSVHPADVRRLLDLYGVSDEQGRDRLVTMSREARQRGWWEFPSHDIPRYIETGIGLEAEATELLFYQIAIVPGLLQTEEYARSLLEDLSGAAGLDEVDQIVALRMKRQTSILRRETPPRFSAIVDEGVLRRQLGGRAVALRQLGRLVVEMEQRDVRVIPFSKERRPQPQVSFSVVGFNGGGEEDVVVIEQLNSSLTLEGRNDVAAYRRTYEYLSTAALSRAESIEFARAVLREL